MLHTGCAIVCLSLACLQLANGSPTGQGSARKILDTCGTANYGQCGGLNCPGPLKCADGPVGCCPSGFSCSRQSEWYWQCLPSNSSSMAVPVTTPAPTPTPTPTPPPASTLSAADESAALSSDCGGLVLSMHNQCGGESNCPTGVSCTDDQWPVGCCPAGSSCTRSNEYYWQCLVNAASTSLGAFNIYDQCGGKSNCPAGASCSDQQWSTGACVSGSQCTRANEWYWQCLPGGKGEAVAVLGPNGMGPWAAYTPHPELAVKDKSAQWIWTTKGASTDAPGNTVPIRFQKSFTVTSYTYLQIDVQCDNIAHITVNDAQDLGWTSTWEQTATFYTFVNPGTVNTIKIDAFNYAGPAGLLVSVANINDKEPAVLFRSDASWTWQVGSAAQFHT